MKKHINLWDLISKKACTDNEARNLQISLGGTARYPMQEITLESQHDHTGKETTGWVLHIFSVEQGYPDSIKIVIPYDDREPITVEEQVQVTRIVTRKTSTEIQSPSWNQSTPT